MLSRFDSLRTSERELLTPLLSNVVENTEIESRQKTEWRLLYQHFGGTRTIPNDEKAIYYLAKRLNLTLPDDQPTLILKWLSWFTTLRLFLLRDCRENDVFQHLYAVKWGGYASILQFSYFLETVACAYQLYTNPELLHDNEWQNTATNAFVWLLVNGVSWATDLCGLNLIGFAFDIWHDYYFVDCEIKALAALKEKLDGTKHREEIQNIQHKITELEYKRFRVTLVAVGIFIGMAIFYLNPFTAAAWVPIAGATMVIIFGVLLGNLGNRLCQWDKFVYTCINDSFVNAVLNGLPTLWHSVKKLLHEFVRPLSITLYDSLANCVEDPRSAFVALGAFALVQLGLYCLLTSCAGLFLLASGHLLISLSAVLAVTEIVVRGSTYLFASSINLDNLKGFTDGQAFKDLVNKDSKKENDESTAVIEESSKQTENYFSAFSKLSPKEFETVAKAAGLSAKELVQLIAIWDGKMQAPGESVSARSSATASPTRTSPASHSSQAQGLAHYSLFANFKARIDQVSKDLATPSRTCWRRSVSAAV